MNTLHYPHWPVGLPHTLTTPETSLFVNLEVSARRYPNKTAIVYYGHTMSYGQLLQEVVALAGYLQQVCKVQRGDRVLLDMQNCPQFVIGYYAILRADAMVVPVNPMLLEDELAYYVADSGARTAIVAQELVARFAKPGTDQGIAHIVSACYSDYLAANAGFALPEWLSAAAIKFDSAHIVNLKDAIAAGHSAHPHQAGPEDLACMPYTSGTTGHPKGCVHRHRQVMFTSVASPTWSMATIPDQVTLAALPMFHVTGMQVSMNSAIYCGASLVILSKWDRDIAGRLITEYGVTSWTSVPSMMVDFLSNPRLDEYNIACLRRVSGGGAAMPAAIAQKLKDLTGLEYMEGYGLSETIAATHTNPAQRLKQQCLGIPVFGVDARVIDPITLEELPQGEVGEIVMHGPQVFDGYWNDPKKTADAFFELDGKRFFRSGDLGYIDPEGFFFFTDRTKRMINASGFKVWPAEVEAMMYRHPGIQECCIIGVPDPYRGETVKAVVVRRSGENPDPDQIMAWAHEHMAAYKVPRIVEFVDALPKSATGKIMWRHLQEKERAQQAR